MRVTLFGASGKVGRQCLQHLLLHARPSDWELVLVARNADRIRGVVADVTSTLPLFSDGVSRAGRLPRILISSKPGAVQASDLVVIAAAAWPSRAAMERTRSLDPSDRLAQSFANLGIVRSLSRHIANGAPGAMTLVVANQSDLMSAAAREILPAARVIGFGGIIDSARFRALAGRCSTSGQSLARRAHMIGYHNDMMIALRSTVPAAITGSKLAVLVTRTRRFGLRISRLQRNERLPDLDSGASVLPGYALFSCIEAYLGLREPLLESFNVALPPEVAQSYGTEPNGYLSVPVRIGRGAVTIVRALRVTPGERRYLRRAQRVMSSLYDLITAHTRSP